LKQGCFLCRRISALPKEENAVDLAISECLNEGILVDLLTNL